MEQFFDSVLQFFKTIATFISTLVSGTVQFFQMLPGVFSFMNNATAYLPSFVIPFFVLGITLLIVKVILDLL